MFSFMDDVKGVVVLLFFLLFEAQITESKSSMKYFFYNFRFDQRACFLTFMKLRE